MKVCPKHDVRYDDNSSCWCCDKAEKEGNMHTQEQPLKEHEKPADPKKDPHKPEEKPPEKKHKIGW